MSLESDGCRKEHPRAAESYENSAAISLNAWQPAFVQSLLDARP